MMQWKSCISSDKKIQICVFMKLMTYRKTDGQALKHAYYICTDRKTDGQTKVV